MVHDCHDAPVEGRADLHDTDLHDDDILTLLRQDRPLVRDRVKLSAKGVAVEKHKFDHTCVPRGCRFSAEIGYWASEPQPPEWQQLLNLISSEPLRIGGSTSVGFGEFECVRMSFQVFDLSNPEDYANYAQMSVSLADTTGWQTHQPNNSALKRNQRVCLTLNPEDYWRVGEGTRSLADEPAKEPNLLPWHESEIRWNEQANINAFLGERVVLIPGSAIKGVLRHRFCFHAHRLKLSSDDASVLAKKATNLLFGQAANYRDKTSPGAQSCLFVSNAQLTHPLSRENIQAISHSSIDRFTGGVRSGALFVEEMLWDLGLEFRLELDLIRLAHVLKDNNLLEAINTDYLEQALSLTLDDLCNGRLALGAGSNRGHGFFTGERDRDFEFSQIDMISDEVAA